MRFDKRTVKIVIITAIITALIVIALMTFAAFKGFRLYIDGQISRLTEKVQEQCVDDPLVYRGKIFVPLRYTRYNRKLATILWDVGGAVSSSNCKEITIPQPYNRSELLLGQDGDGLTMYGQIFWNDSNMFIDHCAFIFSGTYYTSQWNDNMNLNLTSAKHLNGASKDTKIHGGFIHIYDGIREQIWKWLNTNGRRLRCIMVAGRSLGGALATICSYDIASQLDKRSIIHLNYTFASPRVGNPVFAKEFNQRVRHFWRVYNTEDVVIDLPPPIWRDNVYQHVGHAKNGVIFTENLGTLVDNHILAYAELPK